MIKTEQNGLVIWTEEEITLNDKFINYLLQSLGYYDIKCIY